MLSSKPQLLLKRAPLRRPGGRASLARAARPSASAATSSDDFIAWILKAASHAFRPADDAGADAHWRLQPYGEFIAPLDRQKLARVVELTAKVKEELNTAPEADKKKAQPDVGHFIAEAVGTIFSKPDVSDHELFKKAGVTGWSADVVPRSQRGKLVARISTFNQTLRETLDKAKA